jgi:hypothetical protein
MDANFELASLEFTADLSKTAADGMRSALTAIQGVRSVELAPGGATAVVCFDPCLVRPRQLRVAARAVGCGLRRIVLPGSDGLERQAEETARLLAARIG